ncbi:hypothetical protein BIW11_12405 [Tropilaelaps mercedesae]|uniref:Uncharacterized protein n=1 Tax=Tropilaelaps mercedesae TaxID=418985 RepID=A0A1V9X6T2_9ACAR|nr:hypothetical protein BIW11_12405 [Tropilaelaps mercedesae]
MNFIADDCLFFLDDSRLFFTRLFSVNENALTRRVPSPPLPFCDLHELGLWSDSYQKRRAMRCSDGRSHSCMALHYGRPLLRRPTDEAELQGGCRHTREQQILSDTNLFKPLYRQRCGFLGSQASRFRWRS